MIPKSGKIKAFKFQFDILIEKVELAITFPCQISITWKRGLFLTEYFFICTIFYFEKGNQKIETKNKAVLDTTNFIAVFNENLSMMTNLYFEETKNLFLEKKVIK